MSENAAAENSGPGGTMPENDRTAGTSAARGFGGAPAPGGLQVVGVAGLPEFRPGNDLAGAIAAAAPWIVDGDVLVVTSKVVSKAEGRLVSSPTDPAQRDRLRRSLIDRETVRLVAEVGRTKIVENHLGLVAAAAGIDASNVRADEIALLPIDPDASAAAMVDAFADRGVRVGVLITDTQGRAWRDGVTDVVIGGAGIQVLDDHRGVVDEHGNELVVTQVAVGDEMAAAADLVKGKLSGTPVAVLRGLDAPGGEAFRGGGRRLIRPHDQDLFRLGTDLAIAQGRQQTADLAALDLDFDPQRVDRAELGVLIARARGVTPLVIRANLEVLLLEQSRRTVVVAAARPEDQLQGVPPDTVRAGVALQVLRGMLAAEGFAARWLSELPDRSTLPAGLQPLAAIEVGQREGRPA